MSCNVDVVEMYSSSLLLSQKLLISPSILNESLAGYSSLGCKPLLFIIWNVLCHTSLAFSVSVEKSVVNLVRAPFYVTFDFSLAAFKILFVFEFCHFNYDVSWSRPLWVHLDWDHLCSLTYITFSLINLGKFSVITFSNRFSIPCSSSSPFGIPIICILLCFMLSKVPLTPLHSF